MFDNEALDRAYRYCVALTQDDDRAFDLLHSAVARVLTRRSQPRQPFPFLLRTARNLWIDQVRGMRETAMEPIEDRVTSIAEPSLEDVLADRREVARILGLMSATERELLFLWAVEGYTTAELANHLNLPRGTILARLHRLKARLRRDLTERNNGVKRA